MTLDAFIDRWLGNKGGAERSNSQMFLTELVQTLGLANPAPAEKGRLGDYEFEATLSNTSPFGRKTKGFIDLYKRNAFILESKQSQLAPGEALPADPAAPPPEPVYDLFGNLVGTTAPAKSTKPAPYDKLMRDAFDQARGYALSLPTDHRTPPFLIVCDVGRAFEIYFDWADNGRGYGFFPDSAGYRIPFEALRDEQVRALFQQIWTDPKGADPRLRAVEVTRDIATRLAKVAARLETDEKVRRAQARTQAEKSLVVEETSLFLIRLLFCMFAEDVRLIPEKAFQSFLKEAQGKSDAFWRAGLEGLWRAMGDSTAGRYWPMGDAEIRYFNGNLFADRTIYDLPPEEKGELFAAAGQDWRNVEPAIFGTFLEQALDTAERGRLGAHYTPRAYVERLVEATIMDVLRPEWDSVEHAARAAVDAGNTAAAIKAVCAFHDRLAALRILDPACGTGNFLYVAMEQVLRLESKLLQLLASIDHPAGPRVGPHQFLGLELNPRAAVIAEITVWIGWLRFRLIADPASIPDPVLKQTAAINFGRHGGYDALLTMNDHGSPDLANPQPAPWPQADFIVGNPPFIGGKDLRAKLVAGYAEALWKAVPKVPPSADLVMQWWHRAATELTRPGTPLKRFGFVTTNSITQEFSRRVIAAHLNPALQGEEQESDAPGISTISPKPHLSLTYAIPDHPWTKATKDAAAVRIAMTVAQAGAHEGHLVQITAESGLDTDAPKLETRETAGRINADLTVGTDVTKVVPLLANDRLASPGVKLHGAGFIVTPAQAKSLGLGARPGLEAHIREYRNGRDLLQRSRGVMVIDLFGVGEAEVRQRFPEVYQHLLTSVKLGRDEQVKKSNTADARAYAATWWLHGKPRSELRPALAGLPRYIATVETAKHRIFEFLDASILPDNKLIAIGSDSAMHLGVLCSHLHARWTLATCGWLGFGNDPVYVKSKVFDPFPFPAATGAQSAAIAAIAEELESTRKLALAENAGLTMTGLYNMVEALRAGGPLSAEASRARAGIVRKLHEDLDAAVAAAYGWPVDLSAAEIVKRLVALNAERAAEEKTGYIRWLRPEYQKPAVGKAAESG